MKSALSGKLKYADLFMRLSDAGFLLHPETLKILEANSAGERICGEGKDSPVNHTVLEFIPEAEHELFSKAIRISLRRYHPRTFEAHFRGDKEYLMEVMACPLTVDGEDDLAIQVILRDITEKREAEQKLAEANAQLKQLSITDGMTSLYNFRHFQEKLKQEHARSVRYKIPYSLIFCDLDHFKNYNDLHGHPAGDELLKHVAALLQKTIRDTDSVYRYGGEEFVILCPQSDTRGAGIAAERIRKVIERADLPHKAQQPLGCISFSMGVASFPEHGTEPTQVVQAADAEVYQSKKNGRNRVTLAPSKFPDVPKKPNAA